MLIWLKLIFSESEVAGYKATGQVTHYIAQANREKLGMSGMEKIVVFDQSQSLDDFLQLPEANGKRTQSGNGVVTFPGNITKKV